MSAILKALKKIEGESPHEEDATAWPNTVQIGRRQDRRMGRALMFTILSLACGTILIAAVWALTRDRAPLSVPTDRTSKKAAPQTSHPPAKSARRPVPARGTEVPSTDNTALPRSESPGIPPLGQPLPSEETGRQRLPGSRVDHAVSMNAVAKSRKSEESSERLPGLKERLPSPPPRIDRPASPNTTSENRSSQARTTASSPQVPEKNLSMLDNLPTRDDPKITLQAIAWSEKKEDRFAMINNRIIKEGGSVAGCTVVSIGENAVRFRDGGREWYQLFKIR